MSRGFSNLDCVGQGRKTVQRGANAIDGKGVGSRSRGSVSARVFVNARIGFSDRIAGALPLYLGRRGPATTPVRAHRVHQFAAGQTLLTDRYMRFDKVHRVLKTLRHDVKATWLHGWPYLNSRYVRGFPSQHELRVVTPTSGELEIHLLTCARDFQMAVWSALNLTTVTGRRFPLVVHEDGTLSPRMLAALRRYFPNARIITAFEANSASERAYARYPRLLSLRKRLKPFWKLTDFALFCEAARFIILDSDQLFFSTPEELLRGPLNCPYLFLRDLVSTYSVSPTYGGGMLAPRIACGLGNVAKTSLDFERMESFLRASAVDLEHCDMWIEQTLWALECGASGVEYLPESYAIALGPGWKGKKAKHYIGPSRDYFFTEGIPVVEQMLRDDILRSPVVRQAAA